MVSLLSVVEGQPLVVVTATIPVAVVRTSFREFIRLMTWATAPATATRLQAHQRGGRRNDNLKGRDGNDTLNGDDGKDTFFFKADSGTTPSPTTRRPPRWGTLTTTTSAARPSSSAWNRV